MNVEDPVGTSYTKFINLFFSNGASPNNTFKPKCFKEHPTTLQNTTNRHDT